jgi:hypothetical protein
MKTHLGCIDPARASQLQRLGWTVRVFLDGVDVTERYREVDDTPGATSIDIECTRADGVPYIAHLDDVDVRIDCTPT